MWIGFIWPFICSVHAICAHWYRFQLGGDLTSPSNFLVLRIMWQHATYAVFSRKLEYEGYYRTFKTRRCCGPIIGLKHTRSSSIEKCFWIMSSRWCCCCVTPPFSIVVKDSSHVFHRPLTDSHFCFQTLPYLVIIHCLVCQGTSMLWHFQGTLKRV